MEDGLDANNDETTSSLPFLHSISIPYNVEEPKLLTSFPPRIHKNSQLANDTAIQCHIDLCGRANLGKYTDGLNREFAHTAAMMFPECDPDRLPLMAYLFESAVVLDDCHDQADSKEARISESSTYLAHISPLEENTGDRFSLNQKRRGTSKCAAKCLQMDPKWGGKLVKMLTEWGRSMRDIRSKNIDFETFEEYQTFRDADGFVNLTTIMICFASNIPLTDSDYASIMPVIKPIHSLIIQINDFLSWDCEWQRHHLSDGRVPLVNGVGWFMRHHSVSENDAKEMLKNKIENSEAEYLMKKSEFLEKHHSTVSREIHRCFRDLELYTGGWNLWGTTTERYSLNPRFACREMYEVRIRDGIQFFDDSTTMDGFLCDLGAATAMARPDKVELSGGQCIGCVTTIPSLRTLDEMIISEPFKYIEALPAKGVREALLDCFDTWYQVPPESLSRIKRIGGWLHNSSLIIDDIEDCSPMRRGNPATHTIYGTPQAMNSASFFILKAITEIYNLSSDAFELCSGELRQLYLGQAMDLHWSFNTKCPSVEQYISMIDGKTGGLFRLLGDLMQSEATQNRDLNLGGFLTLLGRYFQIRDDYQNLASDDYTRQKGFCEDLDEGKFTLPLIHALSGSNPRLESILQARKANGSLSRELKQHVLGILEQSESLNYVRTVLRKLMCQLQGLLRQVEESTRSVNWILRHLLLQLEIE